VLPLRLHTGLSIITQIILIILIVYILFVSLAIEFNVLYYNSVFLASTTCIIDFEAIIMGIVFLRVCKSIRILDDPLESKEKFPLVPDVSLSSTTAMIQAFHFYE
jgi:uncharacterized integral membrane protein